MQRIDSWRKRMGIEPIVPLQGEEPLDLKSRPVTRPVSLPRNIVALAAKCFCRREEVQRKKSIPGAGKDAPEKRLVALLDRAVIAGDRKDRPDDGDKCNGGPHLLHHGTIVENSESVGKREGRES